MHVHVACNSINELRRREKERGDREIGLAESQLVYALDPKNIYDVTVDTFEKSIDECANIISSMINDTKNFTAFNKMREKL